MSKLQQEYLLNKRLQALETRITLLENASQAIHPQSIEVKIFKDYPIGNAIKQLDDFIYYNDQHNMYTIYDVMKFDGGDIVVKYSRNKTDEEIEQIFSENSSSTTTITTEEV